MDVSERSDEPPLMDLQSFKALALLGRGAKGIAFLVRNQASSHENLALKVISKALIEKKKNNNNSKKKKNLKTKTKESNDGDEDAFKRIWFERDVLNLFNHPLLPKLRGLAVTQDIVSFAIDYCPGGNLNSLRKQQTEKMFSEDLIRFYAAELVLALEYLHGLGIIYRDLKPENILIQENGHLMLVDFDLSTRISSSNHDQVHPPPSGSSQPTAAKKKNRFPMLSRRSSGISPVDSTESKRASSGISGKPSTDQPTPVDRSNSFVGTEEYVAPEIIIGKGHGFPVDLWGLGVVMYEMLYGKTPFRGSNRSETFYRILTKEPELVGHPTALRDLIRKLLEKDPRKRISLEEIKGHEFFRGMDWDSVLSISRPPYIPAPTKWEEEGEEEDMEGINGIDVELYVKEVCDELDVADGEKNIVNKDIWREGLGNNPPKNSDFLVF